MVTKKKDSIIKAIQKQYPDNQYVALIDEVIDIVGLLLLEDVATAVSMKKKHITLLCTWKVNLRKRGNVAVLDMDNAVVRKLAAAVQDKSYKSKSEVNNKFRELMTRPPDFLDMVNRIKSHISINPTYSTELEISRNIIFLYNILLEEIAQQIYFNNNVVSIDNIGTFELIPTNGHPRLTLHELVVNSALLK
ncbi:MAG: hypothetical protein HAW67_02520 [Endozoicomonadaceae bacterium]|nr:hypothetical protein [Endozoicomonadaceae bacterium]